MDSRSPSILENEAVHRRDHVDSNRSHADLKDRARVARSFAVRPCRGAPNAANAASTRDAFVGSDRTQTSKSFVARTNPCTARAWAPTTRYSTSRALNSANRSLKSWFIRPRTGPLHALPGQFPNGVNALRRGTVRPIILRRPLAGTENASSHDATSGGSKGHRHSF